VALIAFLEKFSGLHKKVKKHIGYGVSHAGSEASRQGTTGDADNITMNLRQFNLFNGLVD